MPKEILPHFFAVTVIGGAPAGQILIPGGKAALEFGDTTPVAVNPKPAKSDHLPCGLFSIRNSCFATKISNPRKGDVYELSELLSDGGLVQVAVGSTVTIAVGQQRNFV